MAAYTHVATFIADPARPTLTPDVVSALAALMPNAGKPDWLDFGIACDIPFAPPPGFDNRQLKFSLLTELFMTPADVVIQQADQRRKSLFLADMDSTMIGQECIDELADCVGFKPQVAAITERAMRGEIAFEPALRERVALLKGLAANVVAKVIKERITLTPGGRTLVQTMHRNGAYTALVSGGFTLFTEPLAKRIGFDESRANTLNVENDKFTGTVAEPILGKEAKLATLIELRTRLKLPPWQTMAVGDGANDLAMIKEAGLGVAFHAKPAVAAEAAASVTVGDLTALLYMQGYRRSQFVETADAADA